MDFMRPPADAAVKSNCIHMLSDMLAQIGRAAQRHSVEHSDPEDRILHQVHAATLADKQGISDVDWAKMDDARYTDPATRMPIPPADAAKVLSYPHMKLWDEAMRTDEETLDKI